jgi:Putative prokaryotic signal transducing protein
MRSVYQAENLIDAHLVRGALESEGLRAFVAGEYLTGAIGELPASGLLAVMVDDDDVPAAEAIIREIRSTRSPVPDDDDLAAAASEWLPKPA